ncbi:hypothetical protein JXB12_13375 [candidate division KSB1 bacterium]|nr:hypothetical protein [candidate division KSB1 bacterium]
MVKSARVLLLCLFFLLCDSALYAIGFGGRFTVCGFENGYYVSADAYKSYFSSFINLSRRSSTPIFQQSEEDVIYRYLLQQLWRPRYVLVQATIHPLAAVSSYLETDEYDVYRRFDYSGMNLIRLVGTGYQEPYAVSVMLGTLCLLGYTAEQGADAGQLIPSGSALSGFLISLGHQHILDNIVVRDCWYQFEYILTGVFNEKRRREIGWNFRTGIKVHETHLSPNVFMISAQRDHIDYDWHALSLLKNSRIVYEIHVSTENGWSNYYINRQLFSYSKKIPLKIWSRDVLFRIGGGVLWEDIVQFDHSNDAFNTKRGLNLTFLFQPSIEF